ncbi:MAG: VanZ family protein [Bacteroidota bacterium]
MPNIYLIGAIVWGGVILFLTTMPFEYDPDAAWYWDFDQADKVVHAGLFAIFSFLILSGFKKQHKSIFISTHALLICILCSALFGIITEVAQYYIPSRSPDFNDLLADLLGTIVGIAMFYLQKKIKLLVNKAK